MTNSVRVQLKPETRVRLDEIAKQLGCIYDDKPSLTLLLVHIANGQIKLETLNEPDNKKKYDGLVIRLLIITPFYFVGIINLITTCIANNGGNILTINTQYYEDCQRPPFEGTNKGELCIKLLLPDVDRVPELLNELNSITLEALSAFENNNKEMIKLLQDEYPQKLASYFKQQPDIDSDSEEIKNQLAQFTRNPELARLVIETNCTVGITVKVNNRPNLAAQITEKIAKRGMLVSHIKQALDKLNDDIAYIDIHLRFRSVSPSEDAKCIKKIEGIKKDIRSLTNVLKVQDLDLM